MNAVVRSARDVGPVQERYIPILDGDRMIEATVKFRVSYESVYHRGYGLDPDVEILGATYPEGTDIKPLSIPLFHDLIVDLIEAGELEWN